MHKFIISYQKLLNGKTQVFIQAPDEASLQKVAQTLAVVWGKTANTIHDKLTLDCGAEDSYGSHEGIIAKAMGSEEYELKFVDIDTLEPPKLPEGYRIEIQANGAIVKISFPPETALDKIINFADAITDDAEFSRYSPEADDRASSRNVLVYDMGFAISHNNIARVTKAITRKMIDIVQPVPPSTEKESTKKPTSGSIFPSFNPFRKLKGP